MEWHRPSIHPSIPLRPMNQEWKVVGTCIFLSLLCNGHFPGGPGLAGNRTSPFWILLERRMMEVAVRTGAIRHAKLQSKYHHQQTNTQFFFTCQMPFLSPNQQCQSTEGKFGTANLDGRKIFHRNVLNDIPTFQQKLQKSMLLLHGHTEFTNRRCIWTNKKYALQWDLQTRLWDFANAAARQNSCLVSPKWVKGVIFTIQCSRTRRAVFIYFFIIKFVQ